MAIWIYRLFLATGIIIGMQFTAPRGDINLPAGYVCADAWC